MTCKLLRAKGGWALDLHDSGSDWDAVAEVGRIFGAQTLRLPVMPAVSEEQAYFLACMALGRGGSR